MTGTKVGRDHYKFKHGAAAGLRTAEYRSWLHMRNRCRLKTSPKYSSYGGRGITVCDKWFGSFESFLADMGLKPSPKHSLDRIDNDGNYEPDNCRWATSTEQSRNRRSSLVITANGKTLTLIEWSERSGIKSATIRKRLVELGWPADEAVTVPVGSRR